MRGRRLCNLQADGIRHQCRAKVELRRSWTGAKWRTIPIDKAPRSAQMLRLNYLCLVEKSPQKTVLG